MTDQRDKATNEPGSGVAVQSTAKQPELLSRRAMLRGATIAAPTILTMSGASAALAASSVRTYTSVTTAQTDGNYYCLAENSTLGQPLNGNPNALQIGTTPSPVVYRIPERVYLVEAKGSSAGITEQQMCRNSTLDGTTYYYQATGFEPVKVRRGILMSAAAMASAGASVVTIDNL